MQTSSSPRQARRPATMMTGAAGAATATAATLVLVLLVALQAYAGPGTWRPSEAGLLPTAGDTTAQAMPYCYMGRPLPPDIIPPPCWP